MINQDKQNLDQFSMTGSVIPNAKHNSIGGINSSADTRKSKIGSVSVSRARNYDDIPSNSLYMKVGATNKK